MAILRQLPSWAVCAKQKKNGIYSASGRVASSRLTGGDAECSKRQSR